MPPPPFPRSLAVAATVTAGAAVLLFAMRAGGAISFSEPMQVVTSGAEWESLFAVWKAIRGETIYTDRLKIPFNAVVYNWLFYQTYSVVISAALDSMRLADAWLPTIGRMLTLMGVFAGVPVAYRALVAGGGAWDRGSRAFATAAAVFLMMGPLIGWWGFTVRPDVWAMVLEMAAVLAFARLYPGRPAAAVLIACAFGYAAWAFKQMNVSAVGAIGLFLLLRGDWRRCMLLAAVMIAAWVGTLAVGSASYRENVLHTDMVLVFVGARGLGNLVNAAEKLAPILAMLLALAGFVRGWRRAVSVLWRDDLVRLGALGALVAAGTAVPLSFQTGGAENYFFSLSFFLVLMICRAALHLIRDRALAGAWSIPAMGAGWILGAGAVVWVLVGGAGLVDVSGQHSQVVARAACLATLPGPLYADDRTLALPWLRRDGPHFVLSFAYRQERAGGRAFEGGGIGGMIENGYFGTLAVGGDIAPTAIDGAALDRYDPVPGGCAGLHVFVRRAAAR